MPYNSFNKKKKTRVKKKTKQNKTKQKTEQLNEQG